MPTNKDIKIEKIAKKVLGLKTLETRSSDSLDFSTQPVWLLKEALEAAFEAGETNDCF